MGKAKHKQEADKFHEILFF